MPFKIDEKNCQGCARCISACSRGAIEEKGGVVRIKKELCDDCEECLIECVNNAILYDG